MFTSHGKFIRTFCCLLWLKTIPVRVERLNQNHNVFSLAVEPKELAERRFCGAEESRVRSTISTFALHVHDCNLKVPIRKKALFFLVSFPTRLKPETQKSALLTNRSFAVKNNLHISKENQC